MPTRLGRPKSVQLTTDREYHRQINLLLSRLDEQQRRWYLAVASQWLGHGADRLPFEIPEQVPVGWRLPTLSCTRATWNRTRSVRLELYTPAPFYLSVRKSHHTKLFLDADSASRLP